MTWLYYRFIYRHLMRLMHRFNLHHGTRYYPEGDELERCNWCGMSRVISRRDFKPISSGVADNRAASTGSVSK